MVRCGVCVVADVGVGVPAVTVSRGGVEKMGVGGARCTADGGVYGLWKPDKLAPTVLKVQHEGTYQLEDVSVFQRSLVHVEQPLLGRDRDVSSRTDNVNRVLARRPCRCRCWLLLLNESQDQLLVLTK